jgi:ABC-type branched-subunit amino acid transport system substrate-binding protein
MNNRKVVVVVALSVIAAALALYFYRRESAPSASVVRIAGNIPLSGPTASFSGEYGNGLIMGIDDASKEMGIPRQTFLVDMQDNQGRPADAATIAQKQAITGFDVYVSGTTQMSLAVAPMIDRTPALHLLVSYDAHLAEGAPNRMRILTHFKAEGPVYVEYSK